MGTKFIAVIFDAMKLNVQFYATNASIYHVTIKFSQFSAQLISNMLNQLKDLTSKIIYSKGTYFDEEYVWEGFFGENNLITSIEKLPELMKDIKDCVDIKWDYIQANR